MAMSIDRRTFVLGSGVAAAGAALASLGAVATVAPKAAPPARAAATSPMAAVACEPSFALGILGWDRSDEHTAWIAIDPHWRGAWH
jgi:hypothetical protein